MEVRSSIIALGTGLALALGLGLWLGQRSRLGTFWSTAPARIVCFGDSITEYGSAPDGFVTRLSWEYTRKADVLNRGFSGYTTRLVRRMLPELLAPLASESAHTVAVTLMLGANDASEAGGFQHVPQPEYLDNMREILRALRAAFPSAHVLVLSPPAVDAERWEAHAQKTWGASGGGRCASLVRAYSSLARQAAAETKCAFVEVAEPMMASPAGLRALLVDGLHLSAAGNELVHGLISKALATSAAAAAGLREHYPLDCVAAPELLLAR
jgi:lysophospholipase L1-like esterase